MLKEIKTFEFANLRLEGRSDRKVVEFGKQQVQIEIEWQGRKGKGEKEIVLKKDGKEYRLTVRVEIWSGTWRDKESSNSLLTPPDSDYEYFRSPPAHRTSEGIGWELDSERVKELKLLYPWKTGRIVGAGVFVLIAIGISIFIFWRKKKHKQKIQS